VQALQEKALQTKQNKTTTTNLLHAKKAGKWKKPARTQVLASSKIVGTSATDMSTSLSWTRLLCFF
jgi:hypothetical protein